jgi:hypothetical protein
VEILTGVSAFSSRRRVWAHQYKCLMFISPCIHQFDSKVYIHISKSINADSPSILLHHFLSFKRQLCPFIPYLLQTSRSRTGRSLTLELLPYSIFTMPQTNDSIETTKGSAKGDAMYRLLCIYQIETSLLTIFICQVDERLLIFNHLLQRPFLGGVSTQALYV